jgi:cellulose synthase/poly-beta-1,6-N-acetylglucosamine synthase-like glycosyltransferase
MESAALAPERTAGHGSRSRLDPRLRRPIRTIGTLVVLMPMVVLLAWRLPNVAYGTLLTVYGLAVLTATTTMLYLAYARYEDPALSGVRHAAADATFPRLGPRPKVSFLVAAKDEVDGIAACVRSMVASDYEPMEVIVIDDGSSDGTTEVIRRLAELDGVTAVILPTNVGKKNALVEGARIADGEILAFTDSDCIIESDALRRCVQALVRCPSLGAVSGHARASNADETLLTRIQDVWYEGQFRIAKGAESSFGTVTCVSGPLAVFRREAIYNYLPAWAGDRFLGGEFRFATDRQLTGYVLGQAWRGRHLKRRYASSPFVSEVDWPERVWRVGYVHSARVWTRVPARIRPFLRQQVRWKKSFVRNMFFNGRFMWRRGPGPAALYYGHVLWVLAAPVMAAWHLVWVPLHGMWWFAALYLCGVTLKGGIWGVAARLDKPGSTSWHLRPLMSLLSTLVLAWLLPYSLLTMRRGVWSRSAR